jgi:uncharacterized protein YdiU (UPF0061 family)
VTLPTRRPSTSHTALGPEFYDPVEPAKFPELTLRYRNQRAAASVGLDTLSDAQWLDHFGRFVPIPGSFEQPLALRYHGHQFQHYNPELGDGRGFLFAQLHDDRGRLLDLGTKGTGRTPWSRTADGRLTLKGGVREVLATSMLEALGVDTSKSLSLIETGEELERHDEPSPTRGSVLVRLSHSHVRIGTFQRLAYFHDTDNLSRLLEAAGDRHEAAEMVEPLCMGEGIEPDARRRALVAVAQRQLGESCRLTRVVEFGAECGVGSGGAASWKGGHRRNTPTTSTCIDQANWSTGVTLSSR